MTPAPPHRTALSRAAVRYDDISRALVLSFKYGDRLDLAPMMGQWMARAGRFPTAQSTEFPLAPEAERYYRNGPPLLQRYLPFWLANLIDRMWVVLITIVAAVIPLSRIVPPLYEFRVRRRIFRWYRQLRDIENRVAAGAAPAAGLLEELDKLDARAAHIAVPLSYTDELYNLRSHIALVRGRLRQPG